MSKNHKRGRPKGSKNKATLLKEAQEKLAHTELPPPSPPPKAFKHLGYCKCGAMIGTLDLETKFIYRCPHCNIRGRKNTLEKKRKGETYTSKKDYLEHVINPEVIDHVPLSDELDPKDVKVKE